METLLGMVVGVVLVLAFLVVAFLMLRSRLDRRLDEAFAKLAVEALEANSRRLADHFSALMDGKQALLDRTAESIARQLEQVRAEIHAIETRRGEEFGRLGTAIAELSRTASDLHRVLASSQRRGAWGERMAKDILRLSGLVEGVNFVTQSGKDAEDGRPDFTFFLPNGLKMNMDVKFPLDHYKAYLDAQDDASREAALRALVSTVKGHIKSLSGKGYIDPKVPTVDFVLMFLPSDQLLSLCIEADPDIIDEALQKRVVLCSPLTLYAVLSVVRQATENAALMRTTDEVLKLINDFLVQWEKYEEAFRKLGEKIEETMKHYEALRTTRSAQLGKVVQRIVDLRRTKGLEGPQVS